MTAIVQYHIATYQGKIEVSCEPDDDNELIIARARSILKRQVGGFPLGYQSWKVIERNECNTST